MTNIRVIQKRMGEHFAFADSNRADSPVRVSKAEFDAKVKSGDYKEPKKVNEHGLYSVKNWRGKEIQVVVNDSQLINSSRSDADRSVKDIEQEIREHKRDMKENGIPVKSFMNGGHSTESRRANERLFKLKTELERAQKSTSADSSGRDEYHVEFHFVDNGKLRTGSVNVQASSKSEAEKLARKKAAERDQDIESILSVRTGPHSSSGS